MGVGGDLPHLDLHGWAELKMSHQARVISLHLPWLYSAQKVGSLCVEMDCAVSIAEVWIKAKFGCDYIFSSEADGGWLVRQQREFKA